MPEYKPGQVWKDNMSDLWVVNQEGLLDCEDLEWINRDPEYVARQWPPLILVKDVPEELPLADWEKDLLEKFPLTEEEQDWLDRKNSGEFTKSETSYEQVGTFRLPENVLERLDTVFIGFAVQTYEESLTVLLKKNADYGPKNISESPGGALNGLRVRMWDKMARINNLADSGATPENESLRDSFLDIANYGLIAMMVLDGNWPSGKEAPDGTRVAR